MTSNFKTNELIANSTIVNTLTFGPKSYRILATGGDDCKVNIWRFDKSNENITSVWSLTSNKAPIKALCFDNDEKCVVSGSMNGSIKVFDMSEGKLARNIGGHQTNITALQYHPYGEFIASGSTDCSTKLWDVRNKTCILTYSGHDKEVTCLRFSPDGRLLAASAKDGNLIIYDLVAGKLQNTIKMGSTTHVTTFEFNPAEFLLATVTNIRMIRFYDLESMEMICNTPPESSAVKSICFSHDGNTLYTCSKDTFRSYSWDTNNNNNSNNNNINNNNSSSSYIKMESSIDVPWSKIHEIKVSPTNNLLGGSFQNNFATIWSLDLTLPYESQSSSQQQQSSSVAMMSPPPKSGGNRVNNNSGNNNIKQQQPQQQSSSYVDSYSNSKSPRANNGAGNCSSNTSTSASPRLVSKSIDNTSSDSSGNNNNNNNNHNRIPAYPSSSSSSSSLQQQQQQQQSSSSQSSSSSHPVWASEASSRDLASSMSDTLWRKFREEHSEVLAVPTNAAAAVDEYKLKSLNDDEDEGDDDNDNYGDDNFDNDSVKGISGSNGNGNNNKVSSIGHSKSPSGPATIVSKSISTTPAATKVFAPPSSVVTPNFINNNSSNGRRSSSTSNNNRQPPQPPLSAINNDDPTVAVLDRAMNALRMRESNPAVNNINAAGSNSSSSNISGSNKRRVSNANINNTDTNNNSNIRPPWTDVLPVTNINNDLVEVVGNSVRQCMMSSLQQQQRLLSQQQQQQSQQQRPLSSSGRRSSSSSNNINSNNSNGYVDIYSSPPSQLYQQHQQQQYNAGSVFSADSVRHIRNSRDNHLYLLNECIEQFITASTPLTAQLSTRTAALRMLRKLWLKSDMTDILDYCNVLHESSRLDTSLMLVLVDFFSQINLKAIGLTLSHCIQLIQIFDTMLNNTNNNSNTSSGMNTNISSTVTTDKSEQAVLTAISSLVILLQAFADLIHDTRHTLTAGYGMIDISKEERLQKCLVCVKILTKLKSTRLEQIKKTYRKSNKMFALLVQLQPLIDLAIS